MVHFILNHTRDAGQWLVATIAGWVGGHLFAFWQAPADVPPDTLSNPAVVSALVAGAFLAASKIFDHWQASRRSDKAAAEAEDERNATLTERVQELTQQGWQVYLQEVKELHREQLKFHHNQTINAATEACRERLSKQRFMVELGKVQAHVHMLHVAMVECGKTLPPFVVLSHEELLAGVEDAVEQYRRSLVVVAATPSGAPDE